MKIHQGIKKRFKKSRPKMGQFKLKYQSKGRGSKHLKTKQTRQRRRRIRQTKSAIIHKNIRRATSSL